MIVHEVQSHIAFPSAACAVLLIIKSAQNYLSCRISPTVQTPYDVTDNIVAASGLPRQLEGVVSGDRRSPVLQPIGLDKRAWQVPATRDRPMKPIFTV